MVEGVGELDERGAFGSPAMLPDAKRPSFQRMRRVRPKVSGAGQAVAGSVQAALTS